MHPMPKEKNWRSQKWLDDAKDCPACMYCAEPNHGQVVAAHSNHLRHGKGTAIKSHDIAPYLCTLCHSLVDGRLKSSDNGTSDRVFYEALYNTILWRLREGLLVCK